MSKRNIFQALNTTPDGSCPKNPFSLDHYNFMTSKLGGVYPVDCIETVPDADYDVSVDGYTFTIPCNTANMGQMKENYYFLYVPYSQIFNSAYGFFVQRKDNQSALDFSHEKVPFFNLGDVVLRCIEIGASVNPWLDIHGFNICLGALKLLDLLGYGCYLDLFYAYKDGDTNYANLASFCNNNLNLRKPNVLRIAAYQKAWYCYFRNPIFDAAENGNNDISPRAFNFDDVVYHTAGVTPNFNIMAHRDIDNFIKECLQLRYVGYKKDLITGFMPGTQYGAVSSVPLSVDAAVSGIVSLTGTTGNDVSRWKLTDTDVVTGDAWDITDLRSVFSRNGASVNKQGDDPVVAQEPGYLTTIGQTILEDDVNYDKYKMYHDHTFSGSGSLSSGKVTAGSSLFDVLQLVEAQAIQKWKQKSMLAGQRGINQYRAHYGVVPRHMEDHYPDFLGSVDNPILIDRLVSQANTATDTSSETNLGDLGGRGYGASDKRSFHCHSTEHGVIIVLRAVIPENLYSSYGLDRANMLIEYSDFWQPEYQNIGFESVPKQIVDVTVNSQNNAGEPYEHTSQEYWDTQVKYSNTLGFAPRNYQLKQYQSKVHGILNPTRALKIPFSGAGQSAWVPYGFADMQSFVLPRTDLVSGVFINAQTKEISAYNRMAWSRAKFYVSPRIGDSCFVVAADDFETSDQFISKIKINCSAIQPLSVIGLPQF